MRLPRPTGGDALGARLWKAMQGDLEGEPEHRADLVRLDSVLAERRGRDGEFFDRVASEWHKRAGHFETGQGRHRAATHLIPAELVVADVGCGTGYMASALVGQCSRLICVDRSSGMLGEAEARLGRHERATRVEYRRGELDALPLADGEVDGVLAGMVLHHLPAIDDAIAEMRRALRPGGALVVLELAPHREEWMRAELGDRHLGLEPADVVAALRRAGFTDVVLDPVDDRYRPTAPDGREVSLPLYVVRGRAPRIAAT